MFWAQQSASTLLNPPFALSLAIMFAGLTCLVKKKYMLAVICFGVLSFIKIYAGVLVLGALFCGALYDYFRNKRLDYFKVFLGSLLLAVVLFLPLNRSSGKVLVWQPGWFLETMMAVSDRVNWPKYYEAMINYRAAHNWPKFIVAYVIAGVIFLAGNLGLRIVGLLSLRKIDTMSVVLGSITLAGFLLPMVLLQKGTPWNTIQFLYYALTIMGVFAAFTLSKLNWKLSLLTFTLLSAPGIWGTVKQYLPARPPAMISSAELEALNYLQLQPQGTVLTIPFDKAKADAAQAKPPRPLYRYESTGYIAAYTSHTTYLEDEVNLNITGYDWPSRRKQVEVFFKTQDQMLANKFLLDNRIRYVYLVAGERPVLGEGELNGKEIFANPEVTIWKINLSD